MHSLIRPRLCVLLPALYINLKNPTLLGLLPQLSIIPENKIPHTKKNMILFLEITRDNILVMAMIRQDDISGKPRFIFHLPPFMTCLLCFSRWSWYLHKNLVNMEFYSI